MSQIHYKRSKPIRLNPWSQAYDTDEAIRPTTATASSSNWANESTLLISKTIAPRCRNTSTPIRMQRAARARISFFALDDKHAIRSGYPRAARRDSMVCWFAPTTTKKRGKRHQGKICSQVQVQISGIRFAKCKYRNWELTKSMISQQKSALDIIVAWSCLKRPDLFEYPRQYKQLASSRGPEACFISLKNELRKIRVLFYECGKRSKLCRIQMVRQAIEFIASRPRQHAKKGSALRGDQNFSGVAVDRNVENSTSAHLTDGNLVNCRFARTRKPEKFKIVYQQLSPAGQGGAQPSRRRENLDYFPALFSSK
jgi:hypothetical protein